MGRRFVPWVIALVAIAGCSAEDVDDVSGEAEALAQLPIDDASGSTEGPSYVDPPDDPAVEPSAEIATRAKQVRIAPFGLVHPNKELLAHGACDNRGWGVDWSPLSGQSLSDFTKTHHCGVEMPVLKDKPYWNDTPANITRSMAQMFRDNPGIPIWQMGWEENVHSRCCSRPQLQTLQAELAAVVAARAAAKSNAKIAFQMAVQTRGLLGTQDVGSNEGNFADIKALLASTAAKSIDYLALHPYGWNNYPTPERWLEQFVRRVRPWIASSANPKMKVTFTETGAPVCTSANVGCLLEEPNSRGNIPARGQSQLENAAYLIKTHVLAFHAGVESVLWYEGGEPSNQCFTQTPRTSPEDCFGMSKPTREAYAAIKECAIGRTLVPRYRSAAPGVRTYEFRGPAGNCTVAWTYNGTTTPVAAKLPILGVPLGKLAIGHIQSVKSMRGVTMRVGTSVTVSPAPIFIYSK